MPYIHHTDRLRLDPFLIGLDTQVQTPGDLAYVLYRIMRGFWRRKPGFAQWAAMRGAVEDQVDEFRRQVVDDYENQKRKENGDVT